MKKIHFIANAHIDPVWLWRWQEGYQVVRATFKATVERLKEYPDLYFTSSSACYYQWIEENDPELFEEIKKFIEQGRWELAGGWWIQPDCNIPSGESFVRQGLYAQHYFKSKFNRYAQIGYNVDSFGHNGALPQILKKQGLMGYIFFRPDPIKEMPEIPEGGIFKWISPDGSEVTTVRPYNIYGHNYINLPNTEKLEQALKYSNQKSNDLVYFFGVGNHGGGPTKRAVDAIRKALDEIKEQAKGEFSTLDKFFSSISQNLNSLPILKESLLNHAIGCYSTAHKIKSKNRQCEAGLVNAEKISTITNILSNHIYPLEEITNAWKCVLFSQFHDIITGTMTPDAFEDIYDMLGYASFTAANITNRGLQQIYRQVDTTFIHPEEDALMVFNPHPYQVKFPVEFELRRKRKVFDHRGNFILSQTIQGKTNSGTIREVFIVDVPPLGYKSYRLAFSEDKPFTPNSNPANTDTVTISNEQLKVSICGKSGRLLSLSTSKGEFLGQEGIKFEIYKDESDTWSHNVFKYDNKIGEPKTKKVLIENDGELLKSITTKAKYNNSDFTIIYSIFKDLPYLFLDVCVNWQEPRSLLKMRVTPVFSPELITREIPFAYEETKKDGIERPMQRWICLEKSDKKDFRTLAIINDSNYSMSADDSGATITLLRSPLYAHQGQLQADFDRLDSYMDMGIHKFRYIILPITNKSDYSSIYTTALLLNDPPFSIIEAHHKGNLPPEKGFCKVDNPEVELVALKQSEINENKIIMRLVEKKGSKKRVNIELFENDFHINITPFEIKTIGVDLTKQPMKYEELNLLEEYIKPEILDSE